MIISRKTLVLATLLLSALACRSGDFIVSTDDIAPTKTAVVSAFHSAPQISAVGSQIDDGVFMPDDSPVWMRVCSEGLFVHGQPDPLSQKLAVLERGQLVQVHEWTADGWAYIGGGQWVNGDYLHVDGGALCLSGR